MKNWKDYVGFYESEDASENDEVKVFYLSMFDSEGALRTHVTKIKVKLDMNEDEVGEWVEAQLKTYPVVECNGEIAVLRAMNNVARQSLRAPANTNYENIWFYKGESVTDTALFVTGHNGKFAVFKHPHFEKYGFIVNEKRKEHLNSGIMTTPV